MQPASTYTPISSLPQGRRRGGSPAWRAAAVLAVFAAAGVAAAMSSTGCGSTTTPPFCEGGFIRQQPTGSSPGVCEGKCTASACNESAGTTDAGTGPGSNTCVNNYCALQCASNNDCAALSQDCVAAKEDGTNNAINVCQNNGLGSIGTPCPFGTECKTQFACPDGKVCDPTCTGSSCACPAANCKALSCLTVGTGDAEAYCTMLDCQGDSNCPGGFYCATVRSSDYACGMTPSMAQQELCGKTTDACVTLSQNMANGTTFQQGTACLERNECRLRGECAPCKTDIDCTGPFLSGEHCTMVGSETACTRDCAKDADCDTGFKCTSGACIPRFGACVGTGKFCEPCRNDLDCGAAGSNMICENFGGDERMCLDATAILDPSMAKSCTTNSDCPKSPGGLYGQCADETLGVMAGDAIYHKCFYPPFNQGSGELSCWCANSGKSCYAAADCCSHKCMNPDLTDMIPGQCE